MHTKESSSCSEIPAKQMIETYKKEGYSTIVITDHCSKSKMDRRGGIITEIEIKNIKELVEILQSRNYKLNRNEGTYNGKIKNRI